MNVNDNTKRVAMLRHYDDYRQVVEDCERAEGKAPERDLRGVEPVAVVGEHYPDLYSQQAYLKEDKDRAEHEMAREVKDMFNDIGTDAILAVCESATDFINTELPLEDTDDGSRLTLNRQYVQRIHNGVWERIALAKKLVALYRLHRDLRETRQRQDLTDKNVLL